jgi:hypothetical protein
VVFLCFTDLFCLFLQILQSFELFCCKSPCRRVATASVSADSLFDYCLSDDRIAISAHYLFFLVYAHCDSHFVLRHGHVSSYQQSQSFCRGGELDLHHRDDVYAALWRAVAQQLHAAARSRMDQVAQVWLFWLFCVAFTFFADFVCFSKKVSSIMLLVQ